MVQLKRLPNWHSRFISFLNGLSHRRFAWGEFDCSVGLASGAVKVVTGTDLGVLGRGKYSTWKGALACLKELGFSNLDNLMGSLLPILPGTALALDGDIAFLVESGRPALGVFTGDLIAVIGSSGIGFIPRNRAIKSFAVGH